MTADLVVRLQRGQQFVTARDYFSAGSTWDWTPLLQRVPTLVFNIHDRSALFDLQISRSFGNDTALKAGLRFSTGGKGSEFGGLELASDTGLYLSQPAQIFMRLESYL